jgi:hypothetical protein
LAILVMTGCGRRAHAPASADAPPPSPFDEARYASLGGPPASRPWSPADVSRAVGSLARSGGANLPRRVDPLGGPIFAKLTDPANLAGVVDRSRPVADRMAEGSDLMAAANQLNKCYLGDHARRPVPGEVLEALSYSARVIAALLGVAEEFLATLDRSDPSFPVRMGGLDQMRRGLAAMTYAAVETIAERAAYSAADHARFLEALAETLPAMASALEPPAHAQTRARLDALCADPALAEVRSRIEAIRDAVAKTPPRPWPAAPP